MMDCIRDEIRKRKEWERNENDCKKAKGRRAQRGKRDKARVGRAAKGEPTEGQQGANQKIIIENVI